MGIVKIDGYFVHNFCDNSDNLMFIRPLLNLARNFDLETVVECVKTDEEARLLANEGVMMLRSYEFGKPLISRPWADGDGQASLPLDVRISATGRSLPPPQLAPAHSIHYIGIFGTLIRGAVPMTVP